MQTGTQRGLEIVKFAIDSTASRITVQAFATGLLSVLGHNPTIGMRDYEGQIQFVPTTFEKAHVRVTVRTNAMDVLDEMKGDDRKKLENTMYNEVLEVQRFTEAIFESKEIVVEKLSAELCNARARGDLTFHGVTQPLSFVALVTDLGTMLRISGAFSLRQSDFGIKPFSFAAGALRLKDELKFNFELVARVQD
jgi:polyisoprenoid-binding protein YceI